MAKRKSRMTVEAMRELNRRYKAGEDMTGPFSLVTGKPIKHTPEMAAINAELSKLDFK